MSGIDLIRARFCPDCEVIYDGNEYLGCPRCGDSVTRGQQKWLKEWIVSYGPPETRVRRVNNAPHGAKLRGGVNYEQKSIVTA